MTRSKKRETVRVRMSLMELVLLRVLIDEAITTVHRASVFQRAVQGSGRPGYNDQDLGPAASSFAAGSGH